MLRKVDISHKTIFFIAGFLGLLWLIYQVREVIILIFVSIIFMSGLAPVVERITWLKVPKGVAIAVSYILVLAITVGLLSLMIPPLASETTNLARNLPQTVDQLLPAEFDRGLLQEQLAEFSKSAVSFTFVIFSNFLAFISVAVLTFYLLLDRERLYKSFVKIFPEQKEKVEKLIFRIEDKLGAWLRGQIVLSLVIGSLSYILLLLLDIPYALPLALLAGILEVVPVIGPIISAVPAVLIALTLSPITAGLVALGYFVIQQAENHFIVPQVMKRAVGLNPLIVIIAIAIGSKVMGITGALLAVPTAVVIQILAEDLLNMSLEIDSFGENKKKEETP